MPQFSLQRMPVTKYILIVDCVLLPVVVHTELDDNLLMDNL